MAKVGYKRGIILIFASMKEFANMSFEERSSYILDTMKWVAFHKEDGIWHADIENPECECCEMVNGSEMFLDEISHGGHLCIPKRVRQDLPQSSFCVSAN
jgi:hypothetical protein